MSPALTAYNLLAKTLGWPNIVDAQGLTRLRFCGRNPQHLSRYYCLEESRFFADLFSFMSGQYLVKVNDDAAVELYTGPHPAHPNSTNAALDMVTLEVKEFYIVVQNTEKKFDAKTDYLMQENTFTTYDALPNDFKQDLANFENKEDIYLFARKPYGRIVECRVNK